VSGSPSISRTKINKMLNKLAIFMVYSDSMINFIDNEGCQDSNIAEEVKHLVLLLRGLFAQPCALSSIFAKILHRQQNCDLDMRNLQVELLGLDIATGTVFPAFSPSILRVPQNGALSRHTAT